MSVAKLKKVIWTIFKYATLLLAIFIAVLPLVSCVITAFKTTGRVCFNQCDAASAKLDVF